jgi:hypothetical protein
MAYDFLQQKQEEDDGLVKTVRQKMISAYGDNWQKTVEELKQNYTRKKIREAKAGEVAVQ